MPVFIRMLESQDRDVQFYSAAALSNLAVHGTCVCVCVCVCVCETLTVHVSVGYDLFYSCVGVSVTRLSFLCGPYINTTTTVCRHLQTNHDGIWQWESPEATHYTDDYRY